MLTDLGLTLLATRGTAAFLAEHGIASDTVNKAYEGGRTVVDIIKDGGVQLVLNTTEGAQAVEDSRSMRAVTLADKIPYYTTLAASHAAAQAMKAAREGELGVRSLQGGRKATLHHAEEPLQGGVSLNNNGAFGCARLCAILAGAEYLPLRDGPLPISFFDRSRCCLECTYKRRKIVEVARRTVQGAILYFAHRQNHQKRCELNGDGLSSIAPPQVRKIHFLIKRSGHRDAVHSRCSAIQ
jgi:hypothetical protein